MTARRHMIRLTLRGSAAVLAVIMAYPLDAATGPLTLANSAAVDWTPAGGSTDHGALAVPAARRERLIEVGAETTDAYKQYSVHLQTDGTVTQRVRIATLYLNDSGAERRGNAVVSVDAWRERTTITDAYVLSPEGERHAVDPRTVQVVTADSESIFSDVLNVVIPWPRLQPGAVSVLEYESVMRADRMILPWSQLYFPQHTEGVERLELDVLWDRAEDEPAWATDLDALDCDVSRHRLRCQAGPLDPVPGDPDIEYLDVVPSIVVAQAVTWDELSRAVAGFVHEAQTGNEEIRRTALELTAGATTQAERLARLHAFASRQIRYVGMEHGSGSHVPRQTADTLANRYGDCKDKTVLFLDLARAAGIDAHAVLTSFHYQVDKLAVPAASYFDHMIACGRLDDGTAFCVDLTDRHTGPDATPASLQGIAALRVGTSVAAPERLSQARHRWVLDVESEASFDAAGHVTERLRRTYRGAYAAWVRAGLVDMSTEERTAQARSTYEHAVGSPEELSFDFEGLTLQDEPVVIASESTWPRVVSPSETASYQDPASWLNALVREFASENQRHEYRFSGFRYRGEHRYRAPDGMTVLRLGPSLDFQSAYGSMRRRYSLEDGAIHIRTEVELPQRVVPLAELEDFNRFLELLVNQSHLEFDLRLGDPAR